VVEYRLLYEPHEDETMRVVAEFLCIHGDNDSAADTVQVRGKQVACEPGLNASRRRRWIIKKVYIERQGTISVNRWSVLYYVDYSCSSGEYSVLTFSV